MISAKSRIETNKLLMHCIDFDKALFDETTLSTSEEEYFESFIDGFNKQISLFIKWLESDEAKELFRQHGEYNDIVFDSIREDLEEILHETNLTAEQLIDRIYDLGLDKGFSEIRRTKYYNDATMYGLKVLQDYNFELITTLHEDIIEHIRTQIFLGIVEGEGMPEVAKRIRNATGESLTGKTLTARQRAMMIARTETARAMTQGRLQSYANYGVEKIKILTAGDTNVCPICLEAAYTFNGEMHIDNVAGERIWKITEANNLVPFHPNCRCSVMAYIEHVLGPNPVSDAITVSLAPYNINHSNSFSDVKITNKQFGNVINHQKKRANAKFEFGNSIDNETGQLIHSKDIRGQKNTVNVPKANRPYSVIHNHTNNGGFSGGDAYSQVTGSKQEVCYATTPKGIWIMRDTSHAKYQKENGGISDSVAYDVRGKMTGKFRELADESRAKYQDQYNNAESNSERNDIRVKLNEECFENYNNWLLEEFGVGKRRDNLFEIEFIPKEMINDVKF